ncbi:MAG: helix-turn-helix domain-containing protein [Pseudomonadota bacterium]
MSAASSINVPIKVPISKNPSRAQQREADILLSAVQLFGEEGFHAVSTRKIAAQAGVSEGTLFNYFSSKNALMRRILESIYTELTDNATEILRQEFASHRRLQRLALNHVKVMTRDNALFMRLIQSYLNVDLRGYDELRDSVFDKLNLSYAWVFDVTVREAQERGELRQDVNLSAMRDLFFGGLEYLGRTLFLHDSFAEIESRVASLIDPLWLSMQIADGATTIPLESAFEGTLARLEAVADRLDDSAR